MKAGEKLIYRPSRQPRLQRTVFGIFTLVAWSLYLYLWAPLATFGLWLVGLRTSYLQLYLQQHQVNTALLFNLALIALFCAAVLIGWAEYNRIRFQGIDRRARQPDATIEEMAVALRASVEDVRTLQAARIATVRLGDAASLIERVPSELPLPLPAPADATDAIGIPVARPQPA